MRFRISINLCNSCRNTLDRLYEEINLKNLTNHQKIQMAYQFCERTNNKLCLITQLLNELLLNQCHHHNDIEY